MIIAVDLLCDPPAVQLDEPDDFRGFKVVVRGDGRRAAVGRAPAPLSRVDADGTAHVRIAAVRELAGERADDPQWRRSFDAMIDYAAGRGWVDAEREVVQAHCEDA
jgi:hypothetical protein